MPVNVRDYREVVTKYAHLISVKCPYCREVMTPIVLFEENFSHFHDYTFETPDFLEHSYQTLKCMSCGSIFFATFSNYGYGEADESSTRAFYKNLQIYPNTATKIQFSESIDNISPDFVKIYNDAYEAEQIGLTSICGMGYRKAVEFLIKDYAIYNNPQDKSKIEDPKYFLSVCIDEYMDDPLIKDTAKASTWLGNDETHYTKTHISYDLEDLKNFIQALVSFIESKEQYKKSQNLLGPKATPTNKN